jgi:general secretion pathway protein G
MALRQHVGSSLKNPVRANAFDEPNPNFSLPGGMEASCNLHRPIGGRVTATHLFAAGFTLIELLVVMAIIATLLTLAVPRYFGSVEKSKEAVLKQNLATLRDSLDKYYGDTGRYPDSLDDLVTKKYLRNIPLDPLTENASTWILIAPEDPGKGMVYDVKSGAQGKASDGTAYGDW